MAHQKRITQLIAAISFLLIAASFASGQIVQGIMFIDRDGTNVYDPASDDLVTVAVGVNVERIETGATVVSGVVVNGSYSVTVPPGAFDGPDQASFRITFVLPVGTNFVFVTPNQGVPPAIDSQVDSSGRSDPFTFPGPPDDPGIVDINAGVAEVDDPTGDGTDADGGNDGGTDDNNDDDAGDGANAGLFAGGIEIDASGVLRLRRKVDQTQKLQRLRAKQMRAQMDPVLARPSELRKVSLNRLEMAVASAIQEQGRMTDEMAYLAGLTSISHVFLFPESGDVVIAGPAEGYMPDPSGFMVGIKSGQSTLQLQDLIVALRAFPAGEQPTANIGCSIDPTEEGLARMQQFIQRVAGQITPSDDMRFAEGLRQSLGAQMVTVNGVPANTHFAQIMVEADYRMKLIGIGLEDPPVAIKSYIKRASPSNVARNALQRWYFQPNYDCVRVSDDGLTMALEGEGVKLVGANERIQQSGRRVGTGRVDRASEAFVKSFTQRYAALARKEPVFGLLRNLIDCSIVAAYLQQEDVYGTCSWDMSVFGNESLIPVEIYRTPKTVEPAVNVVWKGGTLMTPIGGGVSIQTARALQHAQGDEDGKLEETRSQVTVPQLADGQWWWD